MECHWVHWLTLQEMPNFQQYMKDTEWARGDFYRHSLPFHFISAFSVSLVSCLFILISTFLVGFVSCVHLFLFVLSFDLFCIVIERTSNDIDKKVGRTCKELGDQETWSKYIMWIEFLHNQETEKNQVSTYLLPTTSVPKALDVLDPWGKFSSASSWEMRKLQNLVLRYSFSSPEQYSRFTCLQKL